MNSTADTPDDSTPAGVEHSDGERGNLDGSNASNGPREHSLEQAQGNGAFDDASHDSAEARMASDAGESGQDNGSMS